jgi:hypothetical protein
MVALDILGRNKPMVKNILEDIEFVDPQLDLPVPDGMCKDCVELELHEMCDDCKDTYDQ